MDIISIIIISFLYFYCFIILYITFLAKKRGEQGAFINNLVHLIVLTISISINLVMVTFIIPSKLDFISFPFNVFILIFIIIFFPLFSIFIFREKKKEPNNFQKKYFPPKELPLKYDIYRKLTHLVVLGIVFSYFIFSTCVNVESMFFLQNLVLTLVGVSLIGLLSAEFIRILAPRIYPLKPIYQILREKELHMRLGPQISMAIGCFSIILLFGIFQPLGPIIICTSMIMAIFGDIASNLIGRLKGKNFIRNTNKTYEGLIAGIIVSYISGFITLLISSNFYESKNVGLITIPLIGAFIIGILDYSNLEIDDNLTFNISLSPILFFISIFIL